MKKQEQLMVIRAKKLGVLIYDVRKTLHKTHQDFAEIMGVTQDVYREYESGISQPSLPQIEMLAFSLNIPIEHFLGNQSLAQSPVFKQRQPQHRLKDLRNRVICMRLRLAQQKANYTLPQLAQKASLSEADLANFLTGQKAIPLTLLESLADILNIRMTDLLDQHGPIGEWVTQERISKEFQILSPELQQFVCKPVNQPFLKLAMRLSNMPAVELRTIAESLLEITF